MATPTPDWDGIKKELDTAFVTALRERYVATELLGAPRFTRDLGVQTLEWKEYGDEEGAAMSMEVPAFQAEDGPAPTTKTAQIPVFVKDKHVGEREGLAAEFAGVDTVEAENKADAMAGEVDNYILFGNTTGPGATTGLLNDANIETVDNSATTNWTVANDAVADLNEALAILLNARFRGQKRLVMNPLDSDLLGSFVTDTSVQLEEKLNRQIQGPILYSEAVSQNKAYLVEVGHMRPVVPRDIGAVGRPVMREKRDQIEGWMRMRWMTALGLQNQRPGAVCEITFDRS